MSVSVELEDFLSYLSAEKGLAENTLKAYGQDLSQFLTYCQVKKIIPLQVSLKQLRSYLASLRRDELSGRSIARKISALRQFYRFLLREGRIDKNPSELLMVMARGRVLPKHLSVEEIFALIAAAGGENQREIRDRAMLEFWYATGCRISEVAGLTAEAIDWEASVVKVIGKGEAQRLIPLSRDAIVWCEKYRDIRHEWIRSHNLRETEIFFLTLNGKGFTRQGIWKIVKKYARRAGLSRNVWPHMIRHSFATHVLQGGADLRAVQELLGHRSISTTEVYTHLDPENLKLMQFKYHPRN